MLLIKYYKLLIVSVISQNHGHIILQSIVYMIVAVAVGNCLVVSLEVHTPHLAEKNNAISIAIGGRRGLGIN